MQPCRDKQRTTLPLLSLEPGTVHACPQLRRYNGRFTVLLEYVLSYTNANWVDDRVDPNFIANVAL